VSLKREKYPGNWRNTFNLALYHLAAGEVGDAYNLVRDALSNGAPSDIIREAIIDLGDFLTLFPDSSQAQAMRDLLQRQLETDTSKPSSAG
jgi:hypothetical protein